MVRFHHATPIYIALDFWVDPLPFKQMRRVRFPYAIPITLSSSIGKDDSLSSCKDGFDSRTRYQLHSVRLSVRTTAFQVVKTGSIPVLSTKANSNLVLMHGYSMFVSFNGCYRNYRQFNAVVALWEGDSLSARLRWVRFPSTAPIFALLV